MLAALVILFFALSSHLFAGQVPVATILGYHEVDDAPTHSTTPRAIAAEKTPAEQRRYTATTKAFAEQLDYLQQNGYSVISLGELVEFLKGDRESLPPRAVVITIDDGWACAYDTMLPMLRERKLPFTLFVYPSFVGAGAHSVTWRQLREMAKYEGAAIESHAYTHPFLTKTRNAAAAADYEAFLKRELLESRVVVALETRKPVRFLAYPYGDFDDEVATVAAEHGYEAAVTVQRQPVTRSSDRFRLGRYLIHNTTTIEQFRTFLLP